MELAMPTNDGFMRKPSIVSEILPYWAARSPERVALVESARRTSYGELDLAVRNTAELLGRMEIRPGDRVMLVCENCCAAVAVYLACTAIEAWPVIVNARLTDREVDEGRDRAAERSR
jgi:long-chain acyl-CoA synthetase